MASSDELEELQMYLAESREHLATIETDLLDMEAAGAVIDEKLVNKVFRAAHSIKGGASFFGLKTIQSLAHKIENVLDLIRARKIAPNPEIINLFLLSFDCLRGMVNDHANSNRVDIAEFVVALSGLASSYLPEKQKESVKKLTDIKTPAGRLVFQVSELDLALVKERGEYVYLIEIDLIHDVHQRGKTPWDVFRTYLACGTLMECELNFDAVGTLDDESSNRIPLDILFASLFNPSLIHSLFEDVPAEKIMFIQGPSDAQAASSSDATMQPELVSETDSPQQSVSIAQLQQPAMPAIPDADTVHQDLLNKVVVEDTLRVNVNLLENLMNLASEMVLSRNQLQNAIEHGDMQSIKSSSQRVSLTTSELQETIMLTRMQPIGNILNKFPRVVRDLGSERNKDIVLEIYGKDVEIDKSMLEGLSEPLTHMVRNAVDHGIEDQDTRVALGKNRAGRITLRAYHAAGQVVVEISDDGKGIDPQKVAQLAFKKGLITEEKLKLMSEAEKRALIFMAGLSTAEKVTDVSGRGVGMDVVKTNLDRLGGKMDIESQVGKGTTFRITLPLTLAIIPSLLVSVNHEKFAIPQMNISELIHVSASQAKTRLEVIGDAEVLVLREKLIPLLRLSEILGIGDSFDDPQTAESLPDRRTRISDRRSRYSDYFTETAPALLNQFEKDRRDIPDRRFRASSGLEIVVINTGVMEYGLVVDELHDTFEIVVRPLGQHLNRCTQYTGASVLGDGRVALILDASGLISNTRLSSMTGSARAMQLQQQKNQMTDVQKDLLSLLLFHNAPGECCAVPLEMVERIEHINRSQIENAGNRRTMQYRGHSLSLLSLKDAAQVGEISQSADLVVLVMTLGGHKVGLLAAQPVDVVETVLNIDASTHRQKGISGSGIIGKETTLLLDMDEIAETVLGPIRPVPQVLSRFGAANPHAITILLVEDSGFFRNQVSKYLEESGYRVLAAEDGQLGLALLRQHAAEVQLVVTDIEMPNMNGLELTRAIKANPELAHLPVIALTTLADEDDITAGKIAGVASYEVKLDKEKLLQAIRQNLHL